MSRNCNFVKLIIYICLPDLYWGTMFQYNFRYTFKKLKTKKKRYTLGEVITVLVIFNLNVNS